MINFKVGDRVKLKSGKPFCSGEDVLTITEIYDDGAYFDDSGLGCYLNELKIAYPNPPHKHRDLIIEWAKGADIQVRGSNRWVDTPNPQWYEIHEYRVKPQSEKDLEIESIQKQMDELKERLEKLKGE